MSENEEKMETPPMMPPPPPPHRRPLGRRLLTWGTLAALLFALGFFVAYFMLFQPAQAKAQVLDATQAQLTTTEQQLADAQAKLDTATVDVKRLSQQVDLLKVQHALTTARLALMEQDTLTATQAVELAQTDLDSLLAGLSEAETVKAISDRMGKVRTALAGKQVNAALSELRTLDENLSFLYQRISK